MKEPRELVVGLLDIAETLDGIAGNLTGVAAHVRELAAAIHADIIINDLKDGMAPSIAGGGPIPEIEGADKDGEGGEVTGEFKMEDLAE